MKNILITGVNSYVGNSLADWLEQWPEKYHIVKISLRDGTWKEKDFSPYDVVVHVAGIVHQKETKKNEALYYKVNRDLTYDLAKKAKKEDIKQFIFLSTMSVYGLEKGVIDENTPLRSKTHYGKSKLDAEKLIQKLDDKKFRVAIIRPPMIYGKNCPGNYQRLRKLALMSPIFPKIDNKRSMIYIDNLSEFIKLLINEQLSGIYHPQNDEYVCTSEMVRLIAKASGKRIRLTKLFNPLLKVTNVSVLKKLFGNLYYEEALIKVGFANQIYNFERSIIETEKS